jgi:type I pantothenate kinase
MKRLRKTTAGGGTRKLPVRRLPSAAKAKPHADLSPYQSFTRKDWARLRADTPMTLDDAEIDRLGGLTQRLSKKEVEEIYLPLSRLLNFQVQAIQRLHTERQAFFGKTDSKVPFVIGIAGSVAVGKSTTARVLQALLARWPDHRRVDLITTDGFLLPNQILEQRGLMQRKGFPESYDTHRLLAFLNDVKAGRPNVAAPLYSHFFYDVLPGEAVVVDRPDVLIVEGLNVLQPAQFRNGGEASPYVSDYFDFSVYIDAPEALLEEWYVKRFLRLRQTAFRDPAAYFRRYALLGDAEARAKALEIWRAINLVNLNENILPTRARADLVLAKGAGHKIDRIDLRRL